MTPTLSHLQDIPLFGSLDATQCEQLARASHLRRFEMSEVLFYEKEEQSKVHYLLEGMIKFYKVDRFDNEIFLYKISAKSLIFDFSKLGLQQGIIGCFANAECLTPCTILSIDHASFEATLQSSPLTMQALLHESLAMVQKLQCIINRDIVFDGTAKVAHFIATDLESFNALKKHEIAYMLHIQPETLSRILKKLIRSEIIDLDAHNDIVILDPKRLEEIFIWN